MEYYGKEEMLRTQDRLRALLNYLQQCHYWAYISERTKNTCVKELSDRHAFAVFYEINGGTDVVIKKKFHKRMCPNLIPSNMDNDCLFAIVCNKQIIDMVLGNKMNGLVDCQYIVDTLGVVTLTIQPKAWTYEDLFKRTIKDLYETLGSQHNFTDLDLRYIRQDLLKMDNTQLRIEGQRNSVS